MSIGVWMWMVAMAGTGSASAASIYDLKITLQDQSTQSVPLSVFEGHPVIVSLFYGSCQYSCPLLMSAVQKVESTLSPAMKSKVRVLLISIDPVRDQPPQLAALAARYKLDLTRWKLATTSEDNVRDIAAVVGLKYRKLPGGDYNHSQVIAVLNDKGDIAARFEGPNPETAKIAATLLEL